MKEIHKIIEQYQNYKALKPTVDCALATVIHVEGSSYRRVGARMLIFQDGTWVGGISGGCLEGDALRKAKLVIHNKKSKIVRYDTREESSQSIGIGLGCNGLIDVLISPIEQEESINQFNNPIQVLEQCQQERAVHLLLTIIDHKKQAQLNGQIFPLKAFYERGELNEQDLQTFQQVIQEVKRKKRSNIVELTYVKLLIEYLAPPIQTLIFGGQYDVFSFAQLNQLLGWKTILICNPQTTNKESLSLASEIIDHRNHVAFPEIDEHTVAILMAHDYKTDKQYLERLLKETNIQYIGMLGPKKRSDKMLGELDINEPEQLNRIFSPVGLDTGATNPEEIAVSIVAEIRAFFSKRTGQYLRERNAPINDRF